MAQGRSNVVLFLIELHTNILKLLFGKHLQARSHETCIASVTLLQRSDGSSAPEQGQASRVQRRTRTCSLDKRRSPLQPLRLLLPCMHAAVPGSHDSSQSSCSPQRNTPAPHAHPSLQLIEALQRCHKDRPYAKFWGACNQIKWDLDNCFKEEKKPLRCVDLATGFRAALL